MAEIVELARGDIPGVDEPWVMVDIRRMAGRATTGGPREAEGGFTFYVDQDQPEDLRDAIHEASQLADKRGIAVLYVRGRNA